MKIRVSQGHSICYRGVWFNQGEVLEVPHGTEFLASRPKYDQGGKLLGQESVSQVEEVEDDAEAVDPKNKGMGPEPKNEEG